MGATRVKTNFAELEQKANLSDQQKDSIARVSLLKYLIKFDLRVFFLN